MELEHYKKICDIQDRCIKGIINKTEYEQEIEIENLSYIAFLQDKVEQQKLEEYNRQVVYDVFFGNRTNKPTDDKV